MMRCARADHADFYGRSSTTTTFRAAIKLVYRIAMPRGMAKLTHQADTAAKRVENCFERGNVDLEVGRELDQDGAELLVECVRRGEQAFDRFLAVREADDNA